MAGTVMIALDPDPVMAGRLLARTVLTQGCFPDPWRRRRHRGHTSRKPDRHSAPALH